LIRRANEPSRGIDWGNRRRRRWQSSKSKNSNEGLPARMSVYQSRILNLLAILVAGFAGRRRTVGSDRILAGQCTGPPRPGGELNLESGAQRLDTVISNADNSPSWGDSPSSLSRRDQPTEKFKRRKSCRSHKRARRAGAARASGDLLLNSLRTAGWRILNAWRSASCFRSVRSSPLGFKTWWPRRR
jgi:hypothetical protein